MKHSKQEQLNIIMTRSLILKRKRDRCVLAGLSTAAMSLLIVLVTAVSAFTDVNHMRTKFSGYGSTLLFGDAGAYVLVAVMSFTVGVITVELIHRSRRKKKQD